MNNVNNMASAMNAVGGPVGGMQMMNNGLAGAARNSNQQHDPKTQLNTYIYDYFVKNELWDCARAMKKSEVSLELSKASPRRRDADGNVLNNGVDDNSLDPDNKDDIDSKRPDDLPLPIIPPGQPQNSFLHDWWCLFWDICVAQRKKPKPGEGGHAMQYVHHTQQQQRLRQEQQHQLLRQMGPQMGPQMLQNMVRIQNGMNMNSQELQRTAMQNSRKATPQMQMAAQMKQQQMQREGSNLDVNGDQRPQSPSSAENAPSPSKRPRLDNGFNGQQMGPNGRAPPQGMPGAPVGTGSNTASATQANHILIQHGINPNQLTPGQFNSFQQQNPTNQQKSIQVYAQNLELHQRSALSNQNMSKGMPNPGGVPNQGSPMMQPMGDGQMNGANLEGYYNGNAQMRGVIAPNGGNHALQDYQMQLMLLEQQNKKRLLMARQEQSDLRPDQVGGAAGGGQPGFQSMSPQGSRSGPSPNPQDQMKRGTPKMGQAGLPGSPLPDGSMPQARGSPAAMGFNAGQMPPSMTPQLYHEMDQMNKNMPGGAPNGNMMRPPSSHPPGFTGQFNPQQLEMLQRQQQAGRMPGQNWQQPQPGQAQMMQQPPPGQQQPQQMGTPQQRTAMPPPQAPPAGNNNGRTQPSSPQQPAAPPTPQPANKANPKAKKGEKKAPRKKGSTANINAGATPSSDADPPPTPTPSTPITPQHPSSFNNQKAANGPTPASGVSQPATTTAMAGNAQMGQAPAANPEQSFGTLLDGATVQQAPEMSLDFTMDGDNVLEQFDFDSFLNTEDGVGGGMNFDISLPYGNADGLEAGSGDV